MITATQRKELEKIKPPKYRDKVKNYLSKNGHDFSLETIQKVYSGKRKNLIVEKAIVNVFYNYMKNQQIIDDNINYLIDEINSDFP
ncbi:MULTISPECIES: hypothetical protein [Tenacibaculum]|uniref:Uncharacterized protein n=2 Tax=Tenacibaculum TaxID=104267 RepID=A0AAE9MQ87_9FLAO|nr:MULTISPECIES: hypothetical protein [Tenacibaculum]AZJ33535.1 hypothetical protein D6200_13550 [Tenacibaculum mesophilum]MCG7502002.1 hypothetical protein [Tenacibaculum sp. Mcav3-52]MCO7185292.1 hypothetical protein [Tenacibaculum sp. XPcli2-G]QFS28775.1 hypothetical protein F9Y86_10360 [Tenacibaculum mesophilum]UTD16194.1 hypothetical protein HER15_12255 [Tenacibaculum mesophilum]